MPLKNKQFEMPGSLKPATGGGLFRFCFAVERRLCVCRWRCRLAEGSLLSYRWRAGVMLSCSACTSEQCLVCLVLVECKAWFLMDRVACRASLLLYHAAWRELQSEAELLKLYKAISLIQSTQQGRAVWIQCGTASFTLYWQEAVWYSF